MHLKASAEHSEISDQFRVIQQFALSLLRQNSLEDLTWDIASNAGRVLGFEDCVVYLREQDHLVQHAAFGIKNPVDRKILNPIEIPMGQGIVGAVAQSQLGEIVPDTSADPRYIFDQYSGRSEITVPIVYEGQTIGVLDSESAELDHFSELDFELFQSVADIAASRIASAINEAKLAEAQRELLAHKQELESKVQSRTREIAKTLKTVETQQTRLRKTESELRQERDWLRSILESVSDGVIAVNHAGTIQMISDAAMTILENLWCEIGSPIVKALPVVPDEGTLFDASGRPNEGCLVGWLKTDSGTEKRVKCSITPVSPHNTSSLAHVISIEDITRQTFLEVEAEKAQRLDSLGILAGGIAHDFNNQLTAVNGLVSAAKYADAGSQDEFLNLAEQTCLRAKKLTDQLLTLSKGGAPCIRPCSVSQIIQDARLIASAGTSAEFEITEEEPLPLVDADPGQIMQVFENIIINAVQATGDGGHIKIALDCVQEDANSLVRIRIADNGPGMDSKLQARIFDPYFSTKHAGHGLGLTTSYSIVQRHNGRLHVDSTVGQGATFDIFLPVSKDVLPLPEPSTSKEVPALKILMLEDDDLVQRSICALLRSLGHSVHATKSGADALDAFRAELPTSEGFDLALLDMTIIGGMNGLHTMQELKKIDAELPIISMSGYNANSLPKESVCFDGHLQKPFSVKQLRSAIDNAIQNTSHLA